MKDEIETVYKLLESKINIYSMLADAGYSKAQIQADTLEQFKDELRVHLGR